MQFVNFKLFKDLGLDYPLPQENADTPFFGFNSLNIKQLQEKAQTKKNGEEENNDNQNKEKVEDEVNIQSKEWKKIAKKEENEKKLKTLFKGLIFYLGREVPIEIFETVIASCGGLFGDESENSAFKEDDKRITHYVVDRPPAGIEMKQNKEYIQPQWIFDCINKKTLLPVSEYGPGKKLPPHLSPFYEVNEKGEYVYEIENEEEIKDEEIMDEKKENKELSKEDKELREMMLSNNKKKLLQKIREEALKKKKTKIKVTSSSSKNNNKYIISIIY